MIEEGLKERLTGAIVLVVAGVIFIPLFLDGPGSPSDVTERRSLPVPDAAPAKPVLSAGSAAAIDRSGSEGRETTAEKPPASNTKEAAASTGPADPLSAWAVQVGSFTSQDNAERLRDALKASGYRAFVTRVSDNGRTLYRVRVGPERERERAEALAERLKKDGQVTAVLRHP